MSIWSVQSTPSHRYFARKRKSEIILDISDMLGALGEPPLTLAEVKTKRALTCQQLASEAMALVRRLPS